MNRKFFVLIFAFLLSVCLGMNAEAETKTESASATYTKEIPVIDGKIDQIWDTAEKLYTDVGKKEGNAYGAARILWTENALYFLVEVEDTTMFSEVEGNLSEGVMLMVSDSSEEWCYFANASNETILDSAGVEIFGEAVCAVKTGEDKYVVEIALPVKKEKAYTGGEQIGFNFFVLDDVNGDYSLDHICSWQDSGMENVTVWNRDDMTELAKIEFVTAKIGRPSSFIKMGIALGGVVGVGAVIVFVLWRKRRFCYENH